jgi:hypothetical protein
LNGGAIWGTLDALLGVVEFEDEFFLRGQSVISQFFENKLNFFFSFLSFSMALGVGVSGGIPQGNNRSFGIFSLGSGA